MEPLDQKSTEDTQDELLLQLKESNGLARRREKLLYVLIALTAAIVILFAIGLITILHSVQTLTEALQQLETFDLSGLFADLQEFAKSGGSALTDIEKAAESLSGIDMSALNDALGDLKALLQSLAEIDVETLNNAIENLNKTVAPLAAFFSAFKN